MALDTIQKKSNWKFIYVIFYILVLNVDAQINVDSLVKTFPNLQQTDISKSSDDLVKIFVNEKYGFKNGKTGKIVIQPKYEEVTYFRNGLAKVKLNNKYGFINESGKEVIGIKYAYAGGSKDDLILVSMGGTLDGNNKYIGGKYGFVNRDGVVIVPIKYDEAYSFSNSDQLTGVRLNNKWGFVSRLGKEVVPLKYSYVFNFTEGFGIVCVGGIKNQHGTINQGKWGFNDETGKQICPVKYADVSPFYKGMARVCIGNEEKVSNYYVIKGKYGYIDKTGKEVIPVIYERDQLSFDGDKFIVKVNGKVLMFDKSGGKIE